jgi:hypothetical protein
MHRRARHLNPGSAGAVLALDSRFITGLSDGSLVSTWVDRSGQGNNATQAQGGGNQPSYKTQQQGGNAVVAFNGTGNWMGISLSNTTNEAFILIVSNSNTFVQFGGRVSFHGASGNDYDDVRYFAISHGSASPLKYRVDRIVNIFEPNTTSAIATTIFNGSSCTLYQGGNLSSSSTSTGSTGFFSWSASTLGARYVSGARSYFGQNDMMQVIVINQSKTNALRKRIEHSAAFAFKIACS